MLLHFPVIRGSVKKGKLWVPEEKVGVCTSEGKGYRKKVKAIEDKLHSPQFYLECLKASSTIENL